MIDPGVRKLVSAMNALPGLSTYSSCEGHDDPKGCQKPKGTFGVSFDVAQSFRGWRALEVLSSAAFAMKRGFVEIHAWDNGSLSFEIFGGDFASADEFARHVRRYAKVMERWHAKRKTG